MSCLQITWFIIWALLWALYFALAGSGLGLGLLLPFLTRNAAERLVVYQCTAPWRYMSKAWLVLAAAVGLAAFPKAAVVFFSALQAPLLLLLAALFLRAAACEFRQRFDKAEKPGWSAFWQGCAFGGSLLAALLLGFIFAVLCQGLPIDGKGALRGGMAALLTPYALCGAALFAVMFLHHGLLWLAFKSAGPLRQRARLWAGPAWLFLLGLLLLFFTASGIFTNLYANMSAAPALLLLPLAALAALCVARFAGAGTFTAWLASGLFMLCFTCFALSGLYPALLPSRLNPAFSLTLANAAAPEASLEIILAAALVFLPLLLACLALLYRNFSGKISN